MSDRTVAQKMGIKPGWRTHIVGAPDGVLDTLGVPPLGMEAELTGEFDYLHLFVRTQEQMRAQFPDLVPHLAPTLSPCSRAGSGTTRAATGTRSPYRSQ